MNIVISEKAVELEAIAMEAGAYAAKCFSARLVAFDERVRMKCQIPLCPHYGKCLTCPPNVPSMEEFMIVVERFKTALLVQTSSPILGEMDQADKDEVYKFMAAPVKQGKKGGDSDTFKDLDSMKLAAIKLHKIVNEIEGKALGLGFPYAIGLIGGECMLCVECVGVGKNCIRPYEARPSMEGVGIDVLKTSFDAGLPFEMPPKTEIIWSGLVLID